MKMTCECTDKVVSIVLMPTTGKLIFNVTTTTTLDDGTRVGSESHSNTVDLPDALLSEVIALNVIEEPSMPSM
jgi:hypothetical protein